MKKIDTGDGGFGADGGRAFVCNDDAVLTDNTYVHEFTPTTVVARLCVLRYPGTHATVCKCHALHVQTS